MTAPQDTRIRSRHATHEAEDPAAINAVAATLWRGKRIIALSCLSVLLVTGVYVYGVATPLYKANATVILQIKQHNIVDLQSVIGGLTGETTEVNTEAEVLRSRRLMGKVADRLDLAKDPEFNAQLRPTNGLNKIRDTVRSFVAPDRDAALSGTGHATGGIVHDAVVTALIKQTSVRNIRQSVVFNVIAETQSPQKSALIADTIVDQYISDQVGQKTAATEKAVGWLTQRVTDLQRQLETAEAKAARFSLRTQLVSLEALQAQERQIKELRARIDTAKQDYALAEERRIALRSAGAADTALPTSTTMPLSQVAQRTNEGPAPKLAFDSRLQLLFERATQEASRKKRQLAVLENAEINLRQQIDEQGRDLITLQQLNRDAETTGMLHAHFLTRLKEMAAQQGLQQPDSRVLSQAVIPTAASAPRGSRLMAIWALLGLALGAGIVLLRESRKNTFRTVEELQAHTGLSVFGSFPNLPDAAPDKMLWCLQQDPAFPLSEPVRDLRTSLLMERFSTDPKVILSTSVTPESTNTRNALALAQSLTALERRVLYVDCNAGRACLNKYIPNLKASSLFALLNDGASFESVVQTPGATGMDMLTSGESQANATDLFASNRFLNFIEKARKDYDAVVIDAPSVLSSQDAKIIAQVSDTILLNLRWDHTSRPLLDAALSQLELNGRSQIGLVLNQVNLRQLKSPALLTRTRDSAVFAQPY